MDTLVLHPSGSSGELRRVHEGVHFEYYYQYFFNTTIVAIATTIVSLALGSMAAYIIDRYPFRFSHLIAYILLGTG